MEILIKRLHEAAALPAYDRAAGSGIDVFAVSEVVIPAGERAVVATGVAMALPVGYVGLIWSRNNMTIKESLQVTVDRIDSGYRDEIQVALHNIGTDDIVIHAGMPIAQILLHKIDHAQLIEAADLQPSDRG